MSMGGPPGGSPLEDIVTGSNLLCVLSHAGGDTFGFAAMSGSDCHTG